MDTLKSVGITVTIMLVLVLPSFSQVKITGKVINQDSRLPIAFVGIGVPQTEVGTISNSDGSFDLDIPPNFSGRSIVFSALGFERSTYPIDSLTSVATDLIIKLKEKTYILDAVTVTNRRRGKQYEMGITEFNGGCFYSDTASAGSAIALLIRNQINDEVPADLHFEFPAYIEEAKLRIVHNTFDEFQVRVRVFSVDSVTGKPAKDLFNKSIVEQSKIRNGFLKFDLSDYNILVQGDFYIVFEWLLQSKDRKIIQDKYSAWIRKHPQLAVKSHTSVRDEKVPYINLGGKYWVGTSFGVSSLPQIINQAKCYYRYTNFSDWLISPVALSATVKLSK